MKQLIITLCVALTGLSSSATIHVVRVWDGYFQFLSSDITIQLGDTVQWLPLDSPSMVHTITSTNIPAGAASFDQIWQTPADTFFQYIPQVIGLYKYECTPHAVSFGMIGSIDVIPATIGLDERDLGIGELHIYPNPATNFLHVQNSAVEFRYRVFDTSANLVVAGTAINGVDISTLKDGIYHLEILGDKPRRFKFIKF